MGAAGPGRGNVWVETVMIYDEKINSGNVNSNVRFDWRQNKAIALLAVLGARPEAGGKARGVGKPHGGPALAPCGTRRPPRATGSAPAAVPGTRLRSCCRAAWCFHRGDFCALGVSSFFLFAFSVSLYFPVVLVFCFCFVCVLCCLILDRFCWVVFFFWSFEWALAFQRELRSF